MALEREHLMSGETEKKGTEKRHEVGKKRRQASQDKNGCNQNMGQSRR
jgi:hypothetical protein